MAGFGSPEEVAYSCGMLMLREKVEQLWKKTGVCFSSGRVSERLDGCHRHVPTAETPQDPTGCCLEMAVSVNGGSLLWVSLQ